MVDLECYSHKMGSKMIKNKRELVGEQLKVFLEFMGLMEFQELLEPMEIVVELTEFLELLEPMVLMAFLLGLKGYFGI